MVALPVAERERKSQPMARWLLNKARLLVALLLFRLLVCGQSLPSSKTTGLNPIADISAQHAIARGL